MTLRYPGSFFKLLLLGFSLVALPLIIALADAYLSLGKQMQRSEAAISQAIKLTRDSRAIGEDVIALERLARQQLVLGDAGVLNAYATRRGPFLALLPPMQEALQREASDAHIAQLQDLESGVWMALQGQAPSPKAARVIVGEFAAMRDAAAALQQSADAQSEANITMLRNETEAARGQLRVRMLALIPVGALLIFASVMLIRRPIRHLSEGIRALGEGRLAQGIQVSGPRDLEALGRELDWLRLRLNDVDEQKTRFLRHVSHELKTPLTALVEGVQLLSDQVSGPLNAEQSEIVSILRSNASRLRQLIENLIDYSGIRFHPIALKPERVSLNELFAQIAADQKLALAGRNLQLQGNDGGLSLQADREKLRVILDNLISNAIKFAPEHSEITLVAQHAAGNTVIEVTDLGPGIAADQCEALFEPFVQGAPPPDPASIKGTGLGLSIVRELMNAHGGEVRLLPNSPQGLRVQLCIPIHPRPRLGLEAAKA